MKKLIIFPLISALISILGGCNNKSETSEITIYAINDFHGSVEQTNQQIGLLKVASFMKQETSKPNTLFFDQGDTWQGSIESNYNYGQLITKAFNEANLSAMTLGNHDFDWGLEKLKTNIETAEFPVLSGNIYKFDWESKTESLERFEGLGEPYAVFNLDCGIKVGLIGTIGESQITSIESSKTQDYCFKEQTTIVQNLSDELRLEQNCDIVILSTHASADQLEQDKITEVSEASGKRYVDLVLNAHTHKREIKKVNNVRFAQFGGYGEIIGKIKLVINNKTKTVMDSYTTVESLNNFDVEYLLDKTDSNIRNIVLQYKEETDTIANNVLNNNFSGPFYSSEQLPNLMAEAIYKTSIDQGFDVDFAYTNSARASFYGSKFTEADLWRSFPFDNEIYIIEVTGRVANYMLRFYNNIYKKDPSMVLTYNGHYKVACIDYIAFHTDTNREYDCFPTREVLGQLKKDDSPYTYRNILKDFLLANQDTDFSSEDYSFSNPVFSRES